MRLINKFFELFSLGLEGDNDDAERWRGRTLSLILILFFLTTLVKGIYSLAIENATYSIVLLTFCCVFLFSLMFSFNKAGSKFWITFNTAVIMAYLSLVYLSDIVAGASSFSVIVFPFLAVMFNGKKRGLYFSFGFLGAVLLLMLSVFSFFKPAVSLPMIVVFFHVFIGLAASFVAYGIRHIWEEAASREEHQLIEAQNSIAHKEEVINQLSHKIRTPLSNIIGVIDLLGKTKLTDSQYDYVNTIHASANNMVNVVNDMVSNNKQGIRILPSEEISFNIYATINNVLGLFQDKNNPKKFAVTLSPDIPSSLIGNSILVKQVFLNIINSIIKNSQGDFKEIGIQVHSDTVMHGKFNLKFKITTNTQIKGVSAVGSGSEMMKVSMARLVQNLDLGITQKLIEAEGKEMILNTNDDGLTVDFALQFKENLQSRSVNNIQEKDYQVGNLRRNNKVEMKDASILIVEDNFSNQQIITLYIKNEVNKIDVAFNGKEALDKFGTNKYDLILMDVQMPVMDGFKATQKIRDIEQGYNSRTPIIAVTANAFPEDRERCLQAGMDDYISKPFQPEELLSKIRKLLN